MDPTILIERGSRWYFYETQHGRWRWDAVGAGGDLLAQSAGVFDSRAACVLDAKAHGYGTLHEGGTRRPSPAHPRQEQRS